ncbi:MAG: DUF932 domain-containing protein [Planctomycetota bacterium]|nr:MAG: DUF932 domain-containing protein [Planctomycetota bacterium]REK25653.1 MAG: DUF932 domain-containing protein [Planctomycetota bacterium]REK31635.1 MAG: DUF932 domain-containing protein [Planctomycetota bacterium]
MLNLMLHCGAHHADRQEVLCAPTPDRTKTWVPIPHHRLLGLVERTLGDNGFQVVNQSHGLWHEGTRYFGLMEVQNGKAHDDYGLVLGLRNSHDKSFPAGIALGSGVFICDNLAFSGEVTIARKHTRFIQRDLPGLVTQAIGRLVGMRGKQDQRIEAYKSTRINDRAAHDLIVRSLDAQVLPVTQVPTVLSEWREPSHAEFKEGGKTVWRLFNGFTEALKGRNLAVLPKRSQALHGLMDAVCGLAV